MYGDAEIRENSTKFYEDLAWHGNRSIRVKYAMNVGAERRENNSSSYPRPHMARKSIEMS